MRRFRSPLYWHTSSRNHNFKIRMHLIFRLRETDFNGLNIGLDMDHIYNLNDLLYTFDFQLINTNLVKMHTLSGKMNIDI